MTAGKGIIHAELPNEQASVAHLAAVAELAVGRRRWSSRTIRICWRIRRCASTTTAPYPVDLGRRWKAWPRRRGTTRQCNISTCSSTLAARTSLSIPAAHNGFVYDGGGHGAVRRRLRDGDHRAGAVAGLPGRARRSRRVDPGRRGGDADAVSGGHGHAHPRACGGLRAIRDEHAKTRSCRRIAIFTVAPSAGRRPRRSHSRAAERRSSRGAFGSD